MVERRPDIIIGAWPDKRFVPRKVRERRGFGSIPAVARGELHEVKSTIILQPGPAALTDGLHVYSMNPPRGAKKVGSIGRSIAGMDGLFAPVHSASEHQLIVARCDPNDLWP